ncbi:ABC transporter ATP-binding protein [Pseudoneobacillus rhizosphaerae]|uniref:Bacitracin transport ATP-binding protein BcrA n=1 Tax=Pseudoneobacillus rhizosphaerae TaxID=2880968 RepID=A0A9C7LBT3_9BACI|nr:ABC transporter ATP-binding protein [Pseudoneobacillus rhizosphaerae]CAG9609492.1 Bacitracin transport ATP-binding protein BcrA [Pseudoneobacillus rhizosphaerae]
MESLVQLKNVKKKIGKKEIIKGLTFDVYPGEVFGFLGPNGAGKTTTIRMMMGLMSITEGEIIIAGKNITTEYSEAIQYVGGIVENPEMYKFLTGYQNLIHFARMHKGITKQRIDEVIKLVGLQNRIREKVKTYSLGMRQRLGLAQALLHNPKLLILDEPTNGLDPAGIREIRDYMRRLAREEGLAVIVSSHLLSEMEMMCDRIAIIQQGSIVDVKAMNDFVSEKESDVHLFSCEPKMEAVRFIKEQCDVSAVETIDGVEVTVVKSEIPRIVKVLVENDIKIYGIAPMKKTLEDRFLEVTGGTSIG